MTIGETIQYHRKRLGMSQEELGQKMHLSRQTVSLWEKDQTVPTVDNLLLLREIFDVSVDELLGVCPTEASSSATADMDPSEEDKPLEHYIASLQDGELEETHLLRMRCAGILPVISLLILFFLAFGMFLSGDVIPGLFVASAFITVLAIFLRRRSVEKKGWQVKKSELLATRYEFSLYSDRMTVCLDREDTRYRSDSLHQLVHVRYDQVKIIASGANYLVYLKEEKEPYYLPKCLVPAESLLLSCVPVTYDPPKNDFSFLWKTFSIILMIASILSIFLAMSLLTKTVEENLDPTGEMWRFFLVTPIPLCSIGYSLILRRQGYSWLKNLIIGGIMLTLLCIFGCFTFIFSGLYSGGEEAVLRVEQTLQMDLPEVKRSQTIKFDSGEDSSRSDVLYYSSEVYFVNDTEEFEAQLEDDSRWLTVLPSELKAISSILDLQNRYDYALIYNLDTGEYNTLPTQSGSYRFLGVYYRQGSRNLTIREYEVNYVQ